MGRKGGIRFDSPLWLCKLLQIVEILFSIVESDGIAKYLRVEVSTLPCLAVPKIEENQKGK